MRVKKLFVSIAIALLATTFAEVKRGHACSCLPPPPPSQAFAEARAVFIGKVISFEFLPGMHQRLAKIQVLKIWKGTASEADSLLTAANSAACGYDFQVGETYIIYAHQYNVGILATNICTRTKPAQHAAEDLKFLESLFVPLALNNSWTYANGQTENVIDTLCLDDYLYYRFNRFREFSDVWLRMTEPQELMIRNNSTEQVWLKFAAEIGEKWVVHGPDGFAEWTVHLQSKSDTVEVPAGTFFPCHRFYFQFHGADNDWIEWYAPNIGPVKRDLYGFAFIEYPLESAFINGTSLPTSVLGGEQRAPIRTFELAQNFPNPFALTNGADNLTVIRYHLLEDAVVTLTVYDLLGREIKMLVQRHELAGEHTAVWDGANSAGKKVPAGIYLYRLRGGNFTQVRKLILIHL
jgi:hypothetical protein